MIEASRTPVNAQAAKQLSRGSGRVETLEEAMRIVIDHLKRPELCAEMRQAVDVRAAYVMTISVEPTWRSAHGMSVSVKQCMKSATPGNNAKVFFGELV